MLRWTVLAVLFAVAAPSQVAILRILTVEGDGAVHVPGTRSGHPLTVAVTDETGKPVSGAAVSFHLPEDGPGGSFVNGLRTDVAVTDSRGRATVRAFQANRLPGRFEIRIVASKEQARAGTVVFQYIGAAGKPQPAAARGRGRRWLMVAAAAGTGVLAAALVSRGPASTPAPAASPAPAPAVVLTIGAPSITVGHP